MPSPKSALDAEQVLLGSGLGLLLLAVASPSLWGQAQAADSARARRIVAVEIRPFNVFPPAEAKSLFPRLVNKIHITTRAGIVRRELLFRAGDEYDSARVAETARNLRGLHLFRRVSIDSVRSDSGLVMKVVTQDGFSTRGDFRFKSSGRNLEYAVSLEEVNFAGTATRIGVAYRKATDRSLWVTTFQRSRLFANKVGILAQYQDRSDGRAMYGAVAQPFFSFSSRSSWVLTGEERKERILRFYGGAWETPRDTLQRRFWLTTLSASWAPRASPSGYLRWGVSAQLRRDDYAFQRRSDTLGRTVSGAVAGYVQWNRARFLVSRSFAGFGREEDIDLSTLLHFGLYLTPTAFGYAENGLVPNFTVRTGVGLGSSFARFNISALARITEAGYVDSGSVHLGGTLVLRSGRRHLTVLHGASGWQKNPLPGAEFDLGLGTGPRAFPRHGFTGDRAFLLTGEYRYLVTDDLFRSAGLGIAAFADYGGAWYSGSPRRTGLDFGIGLRFGLTLATDLEPVRIDLARLVGNDLERGRWVLAIGKGFVFSTNGRLDQ